MALKLKHMEMYFMDNDAEGVRVAWFPSHVLKAYIVPRTKLKGAKQLIEHDQLEHGVYFLIGDTANRRLFKLRETLRCRYEDVPGIDLAQRVCQPDLPAETKAI